MIRRWIRRFTALLISFFLVFSPALAWASFEDEMRGLFNSMVNVSDGGYHQAMGRGVVAGPSVVIRNKRVRTDLINFTPPRFGGGCGGIDMFLGSFSFINAEQFMHLLQSIASNASGYAFKLALSVMCPSCKQIMDNLEKTIRDINRLAGDSCKIAENLVNTAADKLGVNDLKQQMEQGPIASVARDVGSAIGAFDAYLNQMNQGTATSRLSGDQLKALLGNVAWKVLKNNGLVDSAFLSGGGTELAEVLMSVTGTIIGKKEDDSDQAMPDIKDYPAMITYKQVMEGGSGINEVKRYSCEDSDDCLYPDKITYNFEGLQKLVNNVLLGSDETSVSTDSLVYQLMNNNGNLSGQARQLIQIAPFHTTRMRTMAICTMAAGGVGGLEQYAKEASGLIAIEVLEKYMRDVFTAMHLNGGAVTVNVGGKTFNHPLSADFKDKLDKLNKEMREAHNALFNAKHQTLEQMYQNAMKACQVKKLTVSNQKGGSGGK